jgi:hypothetical protein
MSIQGELLEYLHSQVPQRMALSTHLGGDGRICSYYVCPFSTLRKIVDEGIKCRNSLPVCVDLSSPDVQSRRKTVWLGRSDTDGRLERPRDVPIHSCVNLFWNPLNLTFDAFQRNGLLRAEEQNDAEHAILCILELDAERLLSEVAAYWTATKENAASNAFSSFDISYLRRFPWANIFAYGPYTQANRWQPRAAELIVFLGGPGQQHTNPVPRSCFTRVLISSEVQLTEQQRDWLSNTGLPWQRVDAFKPVPQLLKSEEGFIWTLTKYRQTDKDSLSRLVAAFRIVTEFESRFGGPTVDRFVSPSRAHDPHGIGHHTRVMFWSAFLATYPFGQSGTNHHTAAILAALLHDLGRQKEGKDQGHGKRALEKHHKLIEEALDGQTLRESCANAVQMHGIDDSKCPVERRDQLWELLKDADGLERGRFRPPGKPRGCNPTMLRFRFLSNAKSARSRIPWLAWWLAGITKHSQWHRRPCYRLLTDFFCGLGSGLTHGVFQGECRTVAQKLHQELSSLLDELARQSRCEGWEELAETDAACVEYVEAGDEKYLRYDANQKQEWQKWLDSDEGSDWDDHGVYWNDWDDHDLDWEGLHWDDD